MSQSRKHFQLVFERLVNQYDQYSILERTNAILDLKDYLLRVCNDEKYINKLNLLSVYNFKNQASLIETVFKSLDS